MRAIVAWEGLDRPAPNSNPVSYFEIETLTQEDNQQGLSLMNSQWVEGANRIAVDPLGMPAYGSRHPAGPHSWGESI